MACGVRDCRAVAGIPNLVRLDGKGRSVTARAAFKQVDVERAVKGLIAAGQRIAGVEVNDNGFVVLVGEGAVLKRKNKADALYGPSA
jgi:hypothetical protein